MEKEESEAWKMVEMRREKLRRMREEGGGLKGGARGEDEVSSAS